MGILSVLPALLLVPLPTLQLVQVSMPISFEAIGYPYTGAVYFVVCEVFPTLLGTRALLPALLPALQAPKPVAPLLVLLPALLLVLLRALRAPKPLAPLLDKVPLPARCWCRCRPQNRWGRCRHR